MYLYRCVTRPPTLSTRAICSAPGIEVKPTRTSTVAVAVTTLDGAATPLTLSGMLRSHAATKRARTSVTVARTRLARDRRIGERIAKPPLRVYTRAVPRGAGELLRRRRHF